MSLPVERITPVPGQESVWDYPRPPRVELSQRRVQVIFNGITLADTRRAWRVLETSQAPAYYIPMADIQMGYLTRTSQATVCEWKGLARYLDVMVNGRGAAKAAWTYPQPSAGYQAIRDLIAFYPHLMDKCLVDGEAASAMPGGFYGGWITADVVGPFKGGPGTQGW